MLFDLRLNVLNQYVDKFIVIEARHSHSGKKKILNFDIENYKTSINLSDAIDKVINYIKSKGPRKFEYNYNLEINNKLTPETWKNKEF